MKRHQLRVVAILALTVTALIGVIVCVATGNAEGTGFGVLTGILGTATPALFDSLAVERRRRTPGMRAVADDVDAAG